MSLSVGIVGLPNVGKSTLFNALLKKQQALVANYPFATIEPNVGIVPVPDIRLGKLAEVISQQPTANSQQVKWPPIVPATVEFLDIAGLIAGAHKGEGLGNKFLSHIREVDAIVHVVRAFNDGEVVKEGSVDPASDFKTVELELMLADLETLSKQKEPKGGASKDDQWRWEAVKKLMVTLEQDKPARSVQLTEEEARAAKSLSLLTAKPIMVAMNVDETDLGKARELEQKYASELGVLIDQVVIICAKVEAELALLDETDAVAYLREFGVEQSGLERLIAKAFATLGLMTFLTAGEKEVRAWTIKQGTKAPQAAGVIHTDFEKKFIKADVVSFDDFVSLGGWKFSREAGKVRSEGREYVMRDGDVIEFKIGT